MSTSLLSKVGNALKTVVTDAEKVLPILEPFIASVNPVAAAALDDFSTLTKLVTNGATTVAAVKNGDPTNVELSAIVPQVQAFLLQTEALAGKTVVNPSTFTEGASAIAAAVQKILSSVG